MELPPTTTALGRLRLVDVWDYYDGPRLFVAQNAAGAFYIALWADEDDTTNTWLYVAVSEDRLERVQTGQISLRAAYLDPEDGKVFEMIVPKGSGDIALALVDIAQIAADLLRALQQ